MKAVFFWRRLSYIQSYAMIAGLFLLAACSKEGPAGVWKLQRRLFFRFYTKGL